MQRRQRFRTTLGVVLIMWFVVGVPWIVLEEWPSAISLLSYVGGSWVGWVSAKMFYRIREDDDLCDDE